jgi:hypothetical protein
MIRKTGDKGTFYSGEKGTKKIGVDTVSALIQLSFVKP